MEPKKYRRTPTAESFHNMHERCRRSRHRLRLSTYIGVHVCDRWSKFENFLADMGERPEWTSLGRHLDSGDYEPGNCDWQTCAEQGAEMRGKNAMLRLRQIHLGF